MEKKDYAELDWGTQSATPIRSERIEVTVSVDRLTRKYCEAMIDFINLHADKIQQSVKLTVDEMRSYLAFLLTQRCNQVAGNCPLWGKLKGLWVPSFFQYILHCVGEFRDRKYAIDVFPVMDEPSDMTIEQAYEISHRLGEFEGFLHMERAAMPTSVEGDQAVMSFAIIDNTMRSMSRDAHPIQVYAAAFAGFQLRKEAAFSALYRIQYDDVDTIAMQMSLRDVM